MRPPVRPVAARGRCRSAATDSRESAPRAGWRAWRRISAARPCRCSSDVRGGSDGDACSGRDSVRRLDQKTALVTGGASGLGKAIAQRLAAEGARTFISDVQTDLGLRAAAEGGFTFLRHDVRDERSWAEVVREMEAQCGALHILVNNAGIVGPMGATNPENTPL